MTAAAAVVRCLEATQPRVFTLENVQAYEGSASYRLIVAWLNHNGYMWHAETLNAANYGVPQTRRRLILRAVRDALLPGLPPPTRWVGWYEAIEDLIPGLPESAFAPWQLARLPAGLQTTALIEGTEMRGDIAPIVAAHPCCTVKATVYKGLPRAFIIGSLNAGQAYSDGLRDDNEPAMTITARQHPRAWLVEGDTAGARPDGTRAQYDPSFTVKSNISAGATRAWLASGRVVKMTPRALARFQSFPDSYVLPDRASLACCILGNAAPPLLMRSVVLPLVGMA